MDGNEGEKDRPLQKDCANNSPPPEYVSCRDGSGNATDIVRDTREISTVADKSSISPSERGKGHNTGGPALSWCANFHLQ
eukprot:8255182-Ditylum_brightwellii.AAC.1